MPLPFSAEPSSKIVEDLVTRRRHVLEKLLHQLVIIVGELLEHREPRLLLPIGKSIGNVDHLGRRVLTIDVRAFESEIDEAGDNVVFPDRHLTQNQRYGRSGL